MDLGLKDRAALVTGASRGLGAATARQLAREGARVMLMARNAERLTAAAESIRRETGARVETCAGDVAAAADVERAVRETTALLGGLDILVTNAGGPPAGRFDDLTDTHWQAAVDSLLLGTVRLVRAALPHLRRSPAAAVLTITSYAVKQPLPNLILSNSVRLAVIGLTKSLALELGGEGIRFNSILPAAVDTERIQELMQDRAQRAGTDPAEETRQYVAASPFNRLATPEEFGKVAAFLCSPAASYLTGVMLPVDAGLYKGMI
jgi:3-oxoacyl-[acyl-carrier protein] reductase